jgi:hypothetical protein
MHALPAELFLPKNWSQRRQVVAADCKSKNTTGRQTRIRGRNGSKVRAQLNASRLRLRGGANDPSWQAKGPGHSSEGEA